MKEIYFAIQNLAQGKKVIYPPEDSEMNTEHFCELLMPNEKSFQNDILDITIEDRRFICYPYTFPEPSTDVKTKKHKSKGNPPP